MRYANEKTAGFFTTDARAAARGEFLRRTYSHLFGAILVFVGIQAAILSIPNIELSLARVFGNPWSPLFIIGGVLFTSFVANSWAHNGTSRAIQYAGLGLYTLVEAILFTPLIWFASTHTGPDTIPMAGFITLAIFGALTIIVFMTGANFSFLRSFLWLGSMVSIGFVLYAIFFQVTLGIIFPCAMVLLASGWILYDTSKVLHDYENHQYVGAALELFSSIAMLFWYVLRIVIEFNRED